MKVLLSFMCISFLAVQIPSFKMDLFLQFQGTTLIRRDRHFLRDAFRELRHTTERTLHDINLECTRTQMHRLIRREWVHRARYVYNNSLAASRTVAFSHARVTPRVHALATYICAFACVCVYVCVYIYLKSNVRALIWWCYVDRGQDWLDPFVKLRAYERTRKVHRSEMKPFSLPPGLSTQKKNKLRVKESWRVAYAMCASPVSQVFERSARNDRRLTLFISAQLSRTDKHYPDVVMSMIFIWYVLTCRKACIKHAY